MADIRRSLAILTLALIVLSSVPAFADPGDLDPTFSGDGWRTLDLDGAGDWANDVVVLPDGKIVVAGYTASGPGDNFAIGRFRRRGGLDTTFSGDGIKRIAFTGQDQAFAVSRAPGGKILVGGLTIGTANDFAIARLRAGGGLDGSFGGDGKVQRHLGSGEQIKAIAVQANGRILAVGSIGSDMGIARFHADGHLDRTFSANGWRSVDIAGLDIAEAVAVQGDGKIVLAGVSDLLGEARFAVVRLRPGGHLDPTFSGDGRATTDVLPGDDVAFDMLLQQNGKIVVAGVAAVTGVEDFALVRYRPGGARDTTFSGDGMQTLNLGGADLGQSVVRQSDGKLLVAGTTISRFAVARFRPGGGVDTTFGTGGWMTIDLTPGSDAARGMALAPGGGKVVLAGEASGGTFTADFGVARVLLN